MLSRRRFLLAGTLIGAGGLYAHHRGLRYPRLSLEHRALEQRIETPSGIIDLHDLIALKSDSQISLRAIAPEPRLTMDLSRGKLKLSINNIAPDARLSIGGTGIKLLDEEIDGINRHLTIDSGSDQVLELSWRLPDTDGVSFAVIGDTGGGSELDWCLARAQELNAGFLLHLGDFNYSEGEYDQAVDKFQNAAMPCYVSIGNHDFHHKGLIYQQFLDEIGPMNNSFTVAGTRFVNIDTAADFLPVSGGLRGQLAQHLVAEDHVGDTVFLPTAHLKTLARTTIMRPAVMLKSNGCRR